MEITRGTLAFSIAFGHFEWETQGGPLTFLMVPNDSGEEMASGASKSVPENSSGGRHVHRIEGPPEYKDRLAQSSEGFMFAELKDRPNRSPPTPPWT